MHPLKKIIFLSSLLLSLGLSSMVMAQSATERFKVEAIIVEGNERVTSATILAYLPIKTGDEIDLQSFCFISGLQIRWWGTSVSSNIMLLALNRDKNEFVEVKTSKDATHE